jgi:hypothetical protein
VVKTVLVSILHTCIAAKTVHQVAQSVAGVAPAMLPTLRSKRGLPLPGAPPGSQVLANGLERPGLRGRDPGNHRERLRYLA